MYGLLIDGVEVKPACKKGGLPAEPITFIDEIKIWREIIERAAAIASPGSRVDAVRLKENYLTENLPQTNPPANTRPGAEYGVDV